MNITAKMISLIGTSFLVAFATAAPAAADTKPCCRNNGQYFNSSPTTCRNHGGRVVDQQYCYGNYQGNYGNRYGSRQSPSFSITLGNVTFGYSDGYYDHDRRWHAWRNNDERNWYQQNHRGSYYGMRHDRDNDRNRRDWREGRRQDWR